MTHALPAPLTAFPTLPLPVLAITSIARHVLSDAELVGVLVK